MRSQDSYMMDYLCGKFIVIVVSAVLVLVRTNRHTHTHTHTHIQRQTRVNALFARLSSAYIKQRNTIKQLN